MQPLLAVAWLTWKAALRFRLFLVIAVLLIVFAIFPVLWMISASFDNSNSLAAQSLIPVNPGVKNFARLFNQDPEFRFGDLSYWRWL